MARIFFICPVTQSPSPCDPPHPHRRRAPRQWLPGEAGSWEEWAGRPASLRLPEVFWKKIEEHPEASGSLFQSLWKPNQKPLGSLFKSLWESLKSLWKPLQNGSLFKSRWKPLQKPLEASSKASGSLKSLWKPLQKPLGSLFKSLWEASGSLFPRSRFTTMRAPLDQANI